MPKGTKRRKYEGVFRKVLAENAASLIAEIFATSANRPKALAAKAKVSLSTAQRVLEGTIGASIDVIEQIAKALGTTPAALLTPSAAMRHLLSKPDQPETRVVGKKSPP